MREQPQLEHQAHDTTDFELLETRTIKSDRTRPIPFDPTGEILGGATVLFSEACHLRASVYLSTCGIPRWNDAIARCEKSGAEGQNRRRSRGPHAARISVALRVVQVRSNPVGDAKFLPEQDSRKRYEALQLFEPVLDQDQRRARATKATTGCSTSSEARAPKT